MMTPSSFSSLIVISIIAIFISTTLLLVADSNLLFVSAYRCSMQLPFTLTYRSVKMIHVRKTERVYREDEFFCGYSFQKMFGRFDENATLKVLDVVHAEQKKNDEKNDEENHNNRKKTSASSFKSLVDPQDVLIDDVKLSSYTIGKPHQKSGRPIDPMSNEILLGKIKNETEKNLIQPFLEVALEKQDRGSDRSQRNKNVVDVQATEKDPALFFLTVSSLGNFFHCEFESGSTDMSSDLEILMNVEFTSNFPCMTKDLEFDDEEEDY